MNEHHPDIDLIMALASGELPPEEAARIESQLDPAARAELAAQRAVLAGLGELRRPAMTTDESRRLHAAVSEALNLERDRPYATVPRPRRRQWFSRVLPGLAAAASLVAVIAIAVNLAERPMSDEQAAGAPTTMAPRTTAAAAATTAAAEIQATTTTAMLDEYAPAAEEPMAEEPMAEEPMDIEAADLVAAAPAPEEAEAAAEEAADMASRAAEAEPAADAVGVTDTTESLSGVAGLPDFEFSTDRPEEVVPFMDALIAESGNEAFPVAQLPERAAAQGLVCWEYVADAADPEDSVSFMGLGLIDGGDGEAYRIGPDPAASQDPTDEDGPVILVFAHPECRAVDFRDG